MTDETDETDPEPDPIGVRGLIAAPPDVVPWPPGRLGVYCGARHPMYDEPTPFVRILHHMQNHDMETQFWWDFIMEDGQMELIHWHTDDEPHVKLPDLLAAYHAHQWLTENPDNLRDAEHAAEGVTIAW